jgi:hypothetical protein
MPRHDATRAFVDGVLAGGRRLHGGVRLGVRLKRRKRRTHAVVAPEDAMFLVSSGEQPRFAADAF